MIRNIIEKFTYNNVSYELYTYNFNAHDMFITMHRRHSMGVGNAYSTSFMSVNPLKVPPELHDQLDTYIKRGGFAGMTPIEYLNSLGLI